MGICDHLRIDVTTGRFWGIVTLVDVKIFSINVLKYTYIPNIACEFCMSTPTYVKKYATVVVDEVVLSPTEIAIVIDSASQIVAHSIIPL